MLLAQKLEKELTLEKLESAKIEFLEKQVQDLKDEIAKLKEPPRGWETPWARVARMRAE